MTRNRGIGLMICALVFVALVALNSFNVIPSTVAAVGSDVSRCCLVAAVAALGTKTRLRELADIGFKPVALMVGETTFLALAFMNAFGYALVASRARNVVSNPRAIGLFNKTGGTLLVGAGIATVAMRSGN